MLMRAFKKIHHKNWENWELGAKWNQQENVKDFVMLYFLWCFESSPQPHFGDTCNCFGKEVKNVKNLVANLNLALCRDFRYPNRPEAITRKDASFKSQELKEEPFPKICINDNTTRRKMKHFTNECSVPFWNVP